MKKLLILSGKGGTGKTTVASAFIRLLDCKSYADCDVDAPNLHITMKPEGREEREVFCGLPKAVIDEDKCISCHRCSDSCRFDAIAAEDAVRVNPYLCEGCGVCTFVCPEGAVRMETIPSGETFVYHGEKHFSTAKLKMGAGASGKLVAEVKKNMKEIEDPDEVAVIDGSPGIGCPVIASISGVDMVLIVTEPTISGISDLKRIAQTVRCFHVKCAVCINKYDINQENTGKLRAFCESEQIAVVGMISFDRTVVRAANDKKSIVDTDSAAGREIRGILDRTLTILNEKC